MSKNFSERNKTLFNWHNILFPTLAWMLIFLFIESFDWTIGGLVQRAYDQHGVDMLPLITIDNKIPIWYWLYYPYVFSIAVWAVMPGLICMFAGKKKFAKFLGISTMFFIFCLIERICVPTSSFEIANIGIHEIEKIANKTQLQQKILEMLNGGSGYSCFPSNHCSCTILLLFALIDIFFFEKNKKDTTLMFSLKIVTTIIFAVFTIMVCIATFSLKVHYFVDFVFSIILCVVFYLVFGLFRKLNFFEKLYLSFFVNFEVYFGYLKSNVQEYAEYITWSLNAKLPNKTQHLTKNRLIVHYVFADLFCIAIMGLLAIWFYCTGKLIW